MSISFSKDLAVNHRPCTFFFRRIPASYPAYQLEAIDEAGAKITFSMIRRAGGSWQATSPRLPHWIWALEAALAGAIEEREALV